MATIESYLLPRKDKDGRPLKPLTRYMVRFRTPQHTQTKKRGFTTKRDAEAFAATVEVEKMTGKYVAPALGQITIGIGHRMAGAPGPPQTKLVGSAGIGVACSC